MARPLMLSSQVLGGALAGWLGLIAWSGFTPGGILPPAKSKPAVIRVLTWNVLVGTEHGAPWRRRGWPVRKKALEAAVGGTSPDILCVQEALLEQLTTLEAMLPGHRRVGVGRDDGQSAGEHCAILFDASRFQEVDGGTFWLEEPADRPPTSTLLGPKRICTWVRLRDRQNARFVRIYNTHLYLTEQARMQAVRIILARIGLGDPADALMVTGDFNAGPAAPDRRLFEAAGLLSTGVRCRRAGRQKHLSVLRNPVQEPGRDPGRSWLACPRPPHSRREAGEHLSLGPLRRHGRPDPGGWDDRSPRAVTRRPVFEPDVKRGGAGSGDPRPSAAPTLIRS